MNGKILLLACGLVGCIAVTTARADETNFYVGGNIGQSKVKLDDATSDLRAALADAGLVVTSDSK